MYISISKEGLSKPGIDAIICIGNSSDKMGKWIESEIGTTDVMENVFSVPFNSDRTPLSYKEALVSAIEEAATDKYKTIAIPVVASAYALHDDAIIQVIHDTINWDYDFLIEGIFNRYESPEQIVLIVDSENILKDLKAKVRWKKNWSKARKLSYILDFLDLSLSKNQNFERHFVNDKNYRKYLNDFIAELESDLFKHSLNLDHGKRLGIGEFMEKLAHLRSVYRDMDNDSIKYLNTYWAKEFCIETKSQNSFFDLLYNIEPLFPLIKHLVPDDQWVRIHKMANPDYVNHKAKEVISNYNCLVLLLKKIKSLQSTNLPIDMLKDHWDNELWNDVMTSDPRAIETQVKKALARRYDCKLSTIDNLISHKG